MTALSGSLVPDRSHLQRWMQLRSPARGTSGFEKSRFERVYIYSLLATTEIMLCCQVRTHIHCRYTKGKTVASDLVNNLKGSGMIYVFHTSFVAKIEKLVQKSRGTMTKSRKINRAYDNIAIQKSMTSFDLHGLMRPGLIKVTYVHPPFVPFASARRGGPNFE